MLTVIRSVGVMGDERTYSEAIVLRAVESVDGMTSDWFKIPCEILGAASSRIVKAVNGANRVVCYITQKLPSTVEWE